MASWSPPEPWGELLPPRRQARLEPPPPEQEELPLEEADGLSFGEWVMGLPLMPGSSTTVGEHHRAKYPDNEEGTT